MSEQGAGIEARQPARTPQRGTERTEARRLERPHRGVFTQDGRFSLDKTRIPKGYVMEFKRHTLMGQNDRRNQAVIGAYHWSPVPHKFQPHFYGLTCKNDDEHIIVDGLGLYMRPRYLNEEARAEDIQETDHVTHQQINSLRMSSREQVGAERTKIQRTVAAIPADEQ